MVFAPCVRLCRLCIPRFWRVRVKTQSERCEWVSIFKETRGKWINKESFLLKCIFIFDTSTEQKKINNNTQLQNRRKNRWIVYDVVKARYNAIKKT